MWCTTATGDVLDHIGAVPEPNRASKANRAVVLRLVSCPTVKSNRSTTAEMPARVCQPRWGLSLAIDYRFWVRSPKALGPRVPTSTLASVFAVICAAKAAPSRREWQATGTGRGRVG